jgi:hypothetical protein
MKPPKKLSDAQREWADWLLEDWMAAIQIAHAEMDNVDFSDPNKVAYTWAHIETMLKRINSATPRFLALKNIKLPKDDKGFTAHKDLVRVLLQGEPWPGEGG